MYFAHNMYEKSRSGKPERDFFKQKVAKKIH